jgi:hypothetical protein
MPRQTKIVLLSICLAIKAVVYAQEPRDTFVMYQRDSAVIPETEKTVLFFQESEKIPTATMVKTLLITKAKKTVKLSNLMKSTDPVYADLVLADLDNDGKKELLLSSYTGGAHCCDEIYIYKNIASNKYQHAAKLFAGHTVITGKREFIFSLHENFSYFFTCYACTYTDTADEAPIDVSRITLRYNKGKMMIVPSDSELKSIINDNLGKLGEQPYQKIDSDLAQDEGLRKEFAMNLAAYYFSFGKNMLETQKLFNKYYKYPDKKAVWTAFVKQLRYMQLQSDF